MIDDIVTRDAHAQPRLPRQVVLHTGRERIPAGAKAPVAACTRGRRRQFARLVELVASIQDARRLPG